MSRGFEDYLQPTRMCDFDACEAIRGMAMSLTRRFAADEARFQALYRYVKELPYGLEDWDVKASETIEKGWGMCSGKSNLLVALARSVSIPARYRIFRIVAERRLLEWVMAHGGDLPGSLQDLPPQQDHVECEACLKEWQVFDPARDTLLEDGLRRLNIPLERIPVIGSDGLPHYRILASIDDWAEQRQEDRKFRYDRERVFARANEQLAIIRKLGRAS